MRVNILLNYQLKNEVSLANFNIYKSIFNWDSFMHRIYRTSYLSNTLIFSQISCFSSKGNKLGTSPAFSKLFTSSKNDSSLIYDAIKQHVETIVKRLTRSAQTINLTCVSVNRNTPFISPSAVFLKIAFKSSRHSFEVYPLPISTCTGKVHMPLKPVRL